jgi:hypothetical protein
LLWLSFHFSNLYQEKDIKINLEFDVGRNGKNNLAHGI